MAVDECFFVEEKETAIFKVQTHFSVRLSYIMIVNPSSFRIK